MLISSNGHDPQKLWFHFGLVWEGEWLEAQMERYLLLCIIYYIMYCITYIYIIYNNIGGYLNDQSAGQMQLLAYLWMT